MRKTLLYLLPVALVPLAGLALPALAGQAAPADTAATIDLGAVPVKPVVGPLAVTGVSGEDEGDDLQRIGKGAISEAEGDGLKGDSEIGEAD